MRKWLESTRFQIGALTLITFAFVAPRLWSIGVNIVTNTYRLGTLRFLAGENPYALPLVGGDRFEYSPFFAVFYSPFALLPSQWQAVTWALFNCFVFWAGVASWIKITKKTSGWVIFFVIVASMELNISVLYQQVNAFLIGGTLLGLAWYRDKNYFWAGLMLTLMTNLKTLPGLFALALLVPFRRQYWLGLIAGSAVALISPALFVGFSKNVFFHQEWVKALVAALNYERAYQLDIASVLKDFGWAGIGKAAQILILVSSIAVMLYGVTTRELEKRPALWGPWLALGAACLLLVSPRSESPTFVLIAPAYALLALAWEKNPARAIGRGVMVFAAVAVTICFTDVWPKAVWDPGTLHYATKTLGTAVLWYMAVGLFASYRLSPLSKAEIVS